MVNMIQSPKPKKLTAAQIKRLNEIRKLRAAKKKKKIALRPVTYQTWVKNTVTNRVRYE